MDFAKPRSTRTSVASTADNSSQLNYYDILTTGNEGRVNNLPLDCTYKLSDELGQGTYGIVYRGSAANGEPVAVKVLIVDEEEGLTETSIRELVLLQELNSIDSRDNHHVLKLYDVFVCPPHIYIITELLDMDLRKWIKSTTQAERLPHLKKLAKCILEGLLFCHRNGVMHRDLKPHNILIDENLTKIRIGDFGLSRYYHDTCKTLTHEVVTLWYRAPEVLLGDCQYDQSIDIWSAGCILAEIWTGKALFDGDSEINTLFKIFLLLGTPSKGDWPKNAFEQYSVFPKFRGTGLAKHITAAAAADDDGDVAGSSALFTSLLEMMLQVCPRDRADAGDCLAHPFLLS